MSATNSAYTMLGFNKASFGCCDRHSICELGKLDCAIEERDPEAKNYCICYQRNHKHTKELPIARKETKTEDFSLFQEDNGQLSMF